jgi:hypothetical protein
MNDMRKTPGLPANPGPQPDERYLNTLIYVDALYKYPFSINQKLEWYPAIGVQFRVPIASNDFGDFKHGASWGLGLKGGAGMDYSISSKWFVRGELTLYCEVAADRNIEIPEQKDKFDALGTDYNFKVKAQGYYLQPQFRIAVGYRIPKKDKD